MGMVKIVKCLGNKGGPVSKKTILPQVGQKVRRGGGVGPPGPSPGSASVEGLRWML